MLLHSGESSEASSPLQAHRREIPALGSTVGSATITTALPAQRAGQALSWCWHGGHPAPSLPQHPTAAEGEEEHRERRA